MQYRLQALEVGILPYELRQLQYTLILLLLFGCCSLNMSDLIKLLSPLLAVLPTQDNVLEVVEVRSRP